MLNKENIRVVQLIDSLDIGGAERMAVTIANVLTDKISFSGLVCTRKEGDLKGTINSSVNYTFLNKRKSIDIKALFKFRNYIIVNNVNCIHAHGSSYFFAVLTKFILPSVKIIWHDHLGNRVSQKESNWFLRFFSLFFSGVLVVNEELEKWAIQNLKTSNISFLSNFYNTKQNEVNQTFLEGEKDKRIVCLANLKTPKNHLYILKSFLASDLSNKGWTLHFIGKDFRDEYSEILKLYIENNKIEDSVYLYGSCLDVGHILSQAKYGVLASTYEGFPVTLLEYGFANLTVLSTSVGFCSKVIIPNVNGYLFNPNEDNALISLFKALPNSESKNKEMATNLNTFVHQNYTAVKVVEQLLNYYQKWL